MPKISNLSQYTRGWLVGDFEPSMFKRKNVEIAVMKHKANEETIPHKHMLSNEYNLIIQGKVNISGLILKEDDIFIYEPGEISDVNFITDTILLVFRDGSYPSDKTIIKESKE